MVLGLYMRLAKHFVMGTCCHKGKNDAPQQLSPAPEQPPVFRVGVSCEEYEFSLELNLSPDLPLSAVKDMILRKLPQVSFRKFCMKIKHKELVDDTATLKQLLIQSGDHICLQRIVRSESVSIERRSLRLQPTPHSSADATRRESEMLLQEPTSEIVESEDHIRHDAANSRPTHAMLRGRLRDMSKGELKVKADMSMEFSGEAKGKRLWVTAMRAAPPNYHIRLEDLDMNSTTNRSNEQSLKERYFPSSAIFSARIQEQSVVMESDESYNTDESRRMEENLLQKAQHPGDFFQELHGIYTLGI